MPVSRESAAVMLQPGQPAVNAHLGGSMRNRAFVLSALFGLSLVVVGLRRDVGRHQEGRPRHRRRDARGQVVQRGLVGRGPGGRQGHRRHRQQHRDQGAGRLRDQHQDVRRPGLRDDRDRRLRDGRRDDDRRQAVPERQVHRRRPGRLHRRDRQERPDVRLQGRRRRSSCRTTRAWSSRRSRSATSPASSPASVSKTGVIGTVGGINTIPAVVALHQRLSQRRRLGRIKPETRQGRLRLDRHHQGASTTRAPASRSASR